VRVFFKKSNLKNKTVSASRGLRNFNISLNDNKIQTFSVCKQNRARNSILFFYSQLEHLKRFSLLTSREREEISRVPAQSADRWARRPARGAPNGGGSRLVSLLFFLRLLLLAVFNVHFRRAAEGSFLKETFSLSLLLFFPTRSKLSLPFDKTDLLFVLVLWCFFLLLVYSLELIKTERDFHLLCAAWNRSCPCPARLREGGKRDAFWASLTVATRADTKTNNNAVRARREGERERDDVLSF